MRLLRNHNINYIRAFTAISVMLTHFGTPSGFLHDFVNLYHEFIYLTLWSNDGLHFGVIMFVVMSGYLIHSSSKDVPIKDYYFKRIIRIYPLFFITATIGFLTFLPFQYATYFSNLFLFSSIIPISGPPGNEILITVVVEIVIYLIYPIYRQKNMYLIIIISFLVYALNILFYNYLDINPSFISRNLFTLLLYWNIGAFASTLSKKIVLSIINPFFFSFFFVLYLIFTNLFYFKGIHYLWSFILAILFGIFLILVFNFNKKSFKFNFLDLLGEAAYSIFAFHFLIYRLFINFFTLNSFNYLILVVLTFLISILSYFFIEQPINNFRYKLIDNFKKNSS
jgi:peptidoglycan/LPS O-acetylase OafA/YrhL